MTEKFKRKSKCRICSSESENNFYEVKEMLFGTGEIFLYFECMECGCLQLAYVPDDMSIYYGKQYYSFENMEDTDVGMFPDSVYEQRILDVGCGTGKWLIDKAKAGYGRLYGCDPFIQQNMQYGNRIFIKKKTIHEMEGIYDYIHFGDSFEHMVDPLEQLQTVKRLLDAKGTCEIDMPVYPNAAAETFGINWYQWDAPRHVYIHSVKSMEYICNQAGLKIERISYNSNLGQFVVSYLYELGFPMIQIPDNAGGVFPQEELVKFQRYTETVNSKEAGDHASFYLTNK